LKQVPKLSQAPRKTALDAAYKRPVSILTAVSLAHHAKWLTLDRGEFAVVRLNFLADVSHVHQPRAYLEGAEIAAPPAGRKHTVAPFGQLNLHDTAAALVTDQLVDEIRQIVRENPQVDDDDQRTKLGQAIKESIVAHRWRPDAQDLTTLQLVRGRHPTRLRVRDAINEPRVLLGARTVTLYLAFVDYMFVTYKTKLFGRNLVRTKKPLFESGRTVHVNEFEMNGFPFASFNVLEAESVGTPGRGYRPIDLATSHTAEIISAPAPNRLARETIETDVISLYRISNATFPMCRRHALKRDWTEEELDALDMGPDDYVVRTGDLRG